MYVCETVTSGMRSRMLQRMKRNVRLTKCAKSSPAPECKARLGTNWCSSDFVRRLTLLVTPTDSRGRGAEQSRKYYVRLDILVLYQTLDVQMPRACPSRKCMS